MKKKLFKSLLAIVGLLTSMSASAYDFELNGIYYKITQLSSSENTVAVTYQNDVDYGETRSGNVDLGGDDYDWHYISSDYKNCVVVPEEVTNNGTTYKVTSIGMAAFAGSEATTLMLPATITKIDLAAFASSKIEEIYNLATTSQYIYTRYTDYYQYKIKNIHVLKGYASTHSSWYNYGVKITISDDIQKFAQCGDNIYYFQLNDNIIDIVGNGKINDCVYSTTLDAELKSTITNVNIKEGITEIGEDAFHTWTALEDVNLPSTLTSIGASAFYGCKSITNITLPSNLETINGFAFYGCTGIQSLTIPGSVTTIDNGALTGMTALKKIRFDDGDKDLSFGMTSNGSNTAMLKNSPIESAYIGRNFTKYSNNTYCFAFNSQESLTDIEISNSVSSIPMAMFQYCTGLKSVVLPSSITYLAMYAFIGCTSLQSIYCESSTPPSLGTDPFYYVPRTIPLYVMKGTSSRYKEKNVWKEFTNIIENHFDANETNIDITISSANWSTLILPFDAEIPSGLKVYSCSASSGDVLTFENQESIKANTPYIINGNEGTYTFSGIGSAWEDTYNGGWFTGAYVETDVPENSYILAKVSGVLGFYKVTGSNVGKTKVAPYHCYLTPSVISAKGINTFMFNDDSATGVNTIENDNDQIIYDVMGRKLSNLQKGINIVNGKKIIVK